MPEDPAPQKPSAGEGLLLGGAVLAMIGCCGLPLLIAALGSIAIGTLLGVGGGLLAAIALVTIAAIRIRARRRACASPPPKRPTAAPLARSPSTASASGQPSPRA